METETDESQMLVAPFVIKLTQTICESREWEGKEKEKGKGKESKEGRN